MTKVGAKLPEEMGENFEEAYEQSPYDDRARFLEYCVRYTLSEKYNY